MRSHPTVASSPTPASTSALALALLIALAGSIGACSGPSIGDGDGDDDDGDTAAGPKVTDLVSSLLPIGSVVDPRKFDWDEATRRKPASEVFRHTILLGDINAVRFMTAMGAMPIALGDQCTFCHVEDDYPSDDKKPKLVARKMIPMLAAINRQHFDGEVAVTCWTCHRGAHEPEREVPAIKEYRSWFPGWSEGSRDRPGREVYQDLQLLGDLTVDQIGRTMVTMAASLGKGCEFCHLEDEPQEDTEHKMRAREMIAMRAAIASTYFAREPDDAPTCWSCHRGDHEPAVAPPPVAAAAAVPTGAEPAVAEPTASATP